MIKVVRVQDIGNDVLEVLGFDTDTKIEYIVYGWVSALFNPVELSDQEKSDYYLSLFKLEPDPIILYEEESR